MLKSLTSKGHANDGRASLATRCRS